MCTRNKVWPQNSLQEYVGGVIDVGDVNVLSRRAWFVSVVSAGSALALLLQLAIARFMFCVPVSV